LLELAKALPVNEEGWVIKMSDNQRFKIKGAAYLLAHRIMTGATFNRVLEAVEAHQFDAMIEGVPDEFLGQVRLWKAEIESMLENIHALCREALAVAPQGTQKDFALWVQANYPKDFHSYLYAAKAGKDINQIAYRHAFESRADSDRTLAIDEG